MICNRGSKPRRMLLFGCALLAALPARVLSLALPVSYSAPDSLGFFGPASDVVFNTEPVGGGSPYGPGRVIEILQDLPGPPTYVRVFDFSGISIPAGVTVSAVGSRPLILTSGAGAQIRGTIDLSGRPGGSSANGGGGGGGGGGAFALFAAGFINVYSTGSILARGGDGGESEAALGGLLAGFGGAGGAGGAKGGDGGLPVAGGSGGAGGDASGETNKGGGGGGGGAFSGPGGPAGYTGPKAVGAVPDPGGSGKNAKCPQTADGGDGGSCGAFALGGAGGKADGGSGESGGSGGGNVGGGGGGGGAVNGGGGGPGGQGNPGCGGGGGGGGADVCGLGKSYGRGAKGGAAGGGGVKGEAGDPGVQIAQPSGNRGGAGGGGGVNLGSEAATIVNGTVSLAGGDDDDAPGLEGGMGALVIYGTYTGSGAIEARLIVNPDGVNAAAWEVHGGGGGGGAGGGGACSKSTIGEAKREPDGRRVVLERPKVIGYKPATDPGGAYIREPDRSSGIRVSGIGLPPESVPKGGQAKVSGVIRTRPGGERHIEIIGIGMGGPILAVEPLRISAVAVGGGDEAYDPSTGAGQRGAPGGVGLNNVGQIVKLAGWLHPGALPGQCLLNDGSPAPLIILSEPPLAPLPAFASVTGAVTLLADELLETGEPAVLADPGSIEVLYP